MPTVTHSVHVSAASLHSLRVPLFLPHSGGWCVTYRAVFCCCSFRNTLQAPLRVYTHSVRFSTLRYVVTITDRLFIFVPFYRYITFTFYVFLPVLPVRFRYSYVDIHCYHHVVRSDIPNSSPPVRCLRLFWYNLHVVVTCTIYFVTFDSTILPPPHSSFRYRIFCSDFTIIYRYFRSFLLDATCADTIQPFWYVRWFRSFHWYVLFGPAIFNSAFTCKVRIHLPIISFVRFTFCRICSSCLPFYTLRFHPWVQFRWWYHSFVTTVVTFCQLIRLQVLGRSASTATTFILPP